LPNHSSFTFYIPEITQSIQFHATKSQVNFLQTWQVFTPIHRLITPKSHIGDVIEINLITINWIWIKA